MDRHVHLSSASARATPGPALVPNMMLDVDRPGKGMVEAASENFPLQRYAEGTWASFAAMTDEQSGLPADSLKADGTRSVQTSTTNIGAYMWSALVAERLGVIGHGETVDRLGKTMTTLERLERHAPSGQYFNWYDHRRGRS
ncbi:MAG TPA: DUF3131 domain-containing protein [Euzebyales bacterium]|nr:DUF3131 domain-containing protein [Euzebyales bacterium]